MKRIDLSNGEERIQAVLSHYPEDEFVEIVTTNLDPGNIDLVIEKILNTDVKMIYIGLPNCSEELILQLVEGIAERMTYCVFTVPDSVRNALQSRVIGEIDFTFSASLFRAVQEAHRLLLSKKYTVVDEEYVHHSENEDTDRRLQQGEYKEGNNMNLPI